METDKLQLICTEIEKRIAEYEDIMEERGDSNDNTYLCAISKSNALRGILMFINSMQVRCKFKVGDLVHPINDKYFDGVVTIDKITDKEYITDDTYSTILISDQDKWEVVKFTNDNKLNTMVDDIRKECEEDSERQFAALGLFKCSAGSDMENASLEIFPIRKKFNKKGTGEYDKNLPRRKAFILGAQWQKEQLMKDSVEGKVDHYLNDGLMIKAYVKNEELIGGDKVNLLITKVNED